jgi:hypothetical protein
MDVVVDDADVLHERIDACRSHEAVPVRLQLLRERLGLQGDVGMAASDRGARLRGVS